MNLCFINPSITRRPEIYELSKYLASRRTNITILQPSDNEKRSDDSSLGKHIQVEHVPSKSLVLSNSIVSIPIFRSWIDLLFDLVKKDRCDLIHVCDYEYLTSTLPILIRRKCRSIPITIVNDAVLGAGDYSFGSLPMRFLSEFYTRTLGRTILRRYDKAIFLYSTLAKKARLLGLPKEKIEIIPNGIDTKKAQYYQKHSNSEKTREKLRITDNERIILYVGRLVKVKRVEIVLKVAERLVEQGLKVAVLIVGDGPQLARLRQISHSISCNIIFTGYVSEEEKNECYSIADVFVLPSLSEGLPTVLLEASSFRLPIVAAKTGGIPDIVVHGRTGYLANKYNPSQYAELVEQILNNDSLASNMGKNGKEHIERNFSWEKIAGRYETLFSNLLIRRQ